VAKPNPKLASNVCSFMLSLAVEENSSSPPPRHAQGHPNPPSASGERHWIMPKQAWLCCCPHQAACLPTEKLTEQCHPCPDLHAEHANTRLMLAELAKLQCTTNLGWELLSDYSVITQQLTIAGLEQQCHIAFSNSFLVCLWRRHHNCHGTTLCVPAVT